MKKHVLSLLLLTFIFKVEAQQFTIGFEDPSAYANSRACCSESYASVIKNPYKQGIMNTTDSVVQYTRMKSGNNWDILLVDLFDSLDVTPYKYMHAKLWKPSATPVFFKFEAGPVGVGEIESMNHPEETMQWVDYVFSIEDLGASGKYKTIDIFPDYDDPANLTEDSILIYIDDIVFNNDPTPRSFTINFEDKSTYAAAWACCSESYASVVENPYKEGINVSDSVVQYTRMKSGNNWDILLIGLYDSLDVSPFKYMHAKLWKPSATPVFFKFEAGPVGVGEIASKYEISTSMEWVDYVFSIEDLGASGKYKTIDIFPDYDDPANLTEDSILIYIDDIVFNNDPGEEPQSTPSFKTFSRGVVLYPVPVDDVLNIKSDKILSSASIYSINGAELGSYEINSNVSSIPVNRLNTGLYIVVTKDVDNNKSWMKFIKK